MGWFHHFQNSIFHPVLIPISYLKLYFFLGKWPYIWQDVNKHVEWSWSCVEWRFTYKFLTVFQYEGSLCERTVYNNYVARWGLAWPRAIWILNLKQEIVICVPKKTQWQLNNSARFWKLETRFLQKQKHQLPMSTDQLGFINPTL